MRKLFRLLGIAIIFGSVVISCNKESVKTETDTVSQATLDRIAQLGFSTQNVLKTEDGYLVEGDILLSDSYLNQNPSSPILRIAEVEQYRTFNLVTSLPRTITVSTNTSDASLNNAIAGAISRYNAENLRITFQKVSSGGDIQIKLVNTRQYIASAGFPTNSGNPYGTVNYSKGYLNYPSGFMTTVVTHEMGHCIGFRHTDYMNRSFSCGSGGNEGQETTGVGAVHIPGTPTGPDAASWMLACLGRNTDRPFNSNDKTALDYLY